MNGLAECETRMKEVAEWATDLDAESPPRPRPAPRPMRQLIPAVLARYGIAPAPRPLAVSPVGASLSAAACEPAGCP